MAFLGLFYAFMVWIVVEAYGADHAREAATENPAEMYFNAMEQYVGGWARSLMEVLILTSILASLLAFHNAITRYTYSLSREGILPAPLGELHPRHLSPHRASAWQSALAATVVIIFAALHLDPITQLMIWVNSPGVFGVVLLQVAVAVADTNAFGTGPITHAPLIEALGRDVPAYIVMFDAHSAVASPAALQRAG